MNPEPVLSLPELDPTKNVSPLALFVSLTEDPWLIEPFRHSLQGFAGNTYLLKTLTVQALGERYKEPWLLIFCILTEG
jgi:hypothetical protein